MRQDYLREMGIDEWQKRDCKATKTKSSLRNYYHYFFHDTSNNPKGLLIADMQSQTEEEASLIEAIAKATRLAYSRKTEQLPSSLAAVDESIPVLILLGQDCASKLLDTNKDISDLRGKEHQFAGRSIFISYAPADLLANKKLKGAAWHDLQLAMQLMH